jgi:nitronate monooxygenase
MAEVMKGLGLDLPLLQAPMGGGFTTPELAAAVSEAGGLGSLGAPYMEPEAIVEAANAVRARTSRPFGINLFIIETPWVPDSVIERTAELLTPYCHELGIEPPRLTGPAHPDVDAQIEAVMAIRPAVFSFTLGVPSPAVLAEMKRLGIVTIGTATTLEEGLALEAAGVDAVCAQGSEAGGHRGTFIGHWSDAMIGLAPLTRQLKSRLTVPVIAAGGLMTGQACAAALKLGAEAVQLGTAFLACPEAGTPAPHRAVLLSEAARRTDITLAMSGKPARGVVNRYMTEMAGKAAEMAPFPITNAMTRGLRGAAARQNRPEFMSLWAGQGASFARAMPAAELVSTLKAEMGL